MATVSQSLQDRFRNWSRITLWTIVVLMMGYVIYHNERFLINSADPVWQHYQPFKWWLLPHGLAGACALFLGPMQFSDRLRQRYLKLHKTVGWIYVVGAMIVAPFGAYIQYFEERMQQPRSFTMAAASDAGLLMLTTAIALFFVFRGNIQQHRQWMTRSYAVALVFLEVTRDLGSIRLRQQPDGDRGHRLDVRDLLRADRRHRPELAGVQARQNHPTKSCGSESSLGTIAQYQIRFVYFRCGDASLSLYMYLMLGL